MAGSSGITVLVEQRQRLLARLEQEREQLEALRAIVADLVDRVDHGERMLSDINSVLGKEPQLRLDEADMRLRGRRLEEIAIQVLAEERGGKEAVHYRDWFELLRQRGHRVAGKQPLNTFLAQINRSAAVEKVGRRSGLYRLAQAA